MPPPVFLTAEWRALVMLNFAVAPEALQPLVPAGTELDRFGDLILMSLVGFRFLHTRVLGVPIPWHTDFDEVNLRFYVRRVVAGEVRRAVVFVKEIVPRRAIAWVARAVYGENYVALPMHHHALLPGRVSYEWHDRGRWNQLAATVTGEPAATEPGSQEEFITEHYWGYARQRKGTTVEYQVEHPRWKVWRAQHGAADADFDSLYGPRLAPFLREPPLSAFVADGSAVSVRRGVLL